MALTAYLLKAMYLQRNLLVRMNCTVILLNLDLNGCGDNKTNY